MERTLAGSDCLVVGGAGFVGSNLVQRLLDLDVARIDVVDNLLSAERSNVPDDDRVRFRHASINDPGVRDALAGSVDFAFHLATYHGNQSSIADPLADHENNTVTTLHLCEAFKGDERLQALVYASAGCTVAEKKFGDAKPTTEDDPVSLYLDSPYQVSKIVGEMYLNFYLMNHGLPGVKARFQNVYGPREILGAGQWRGTPATVWRNVVPTFIYRALKGLPLTLHNGGDASRDFIHVDDLVSGLIRCAQAGEPGGVYNLASGVETTILELAETVLELAGSSSELIVAPKRDWDRSGHRFGSTEKAATELGFKATVDLRSGLQTAIDWFRQNQAMIEATMAKHADQVDLAS